jgi:hypothetical protein
MENTQDINAGAVRSSAWLAADGDTQWQCTVCGRIGSVGRCCGDEARKPLNEAARKEAERIKAANAKLSHAAESERGTGNKTL